MFLKLRDFHVFILKKDKRQITSQKKQEKKRYFLEKIKKEDKCPKEIRKDQFC